MEQQTHSLRIAQHLGKAWQFHQSPAFIRYAWHTFGCTISEPGKCDAIYIGEAESGDAGSGGIGGMIRQWWVIDNRGMFLTNLVNLPRHRDAPENLRSKFYINPVIKFLVQGETIAIGESFGPEMHCRKIGKVFLIDDKIVIHDLRIIWSSNTI